MKDLIASLKRYSDVLVLRAIPHEAEDVLDEGIQVERFIAALLVIGEGNEIPDDLRNAADLLVDMDKRLGCF